MFFFKKKRADEMRISDWSSDVGSSDLGARLGGSLVARLGILRSLLLCGVLQAASNLVFALQAWVGYSVPMLTVTIGVENLTGGMGTTAFVAYLSSLCDRAYRSEEHTSELQSLMRISYAVFCLTKKK